VALGGAERYTRDLAFLCRDLGLEPTVRQFGTRYWERPYEGFKVKGYPYPVDAQDCVERVMKPDLDAADHVIYVWVGCQRVYKPKAITISHGIWFDMPPGDRQRGLDFMQSFVQPALAQVSRFVTVDLSFLEYCRCTIPRANYNKMLYIPNYVDTALFHPGERAVDGMVEILYPRRYAPERGIYLMQEIIPGLLTQYPNVRFNFAIDRNSSQLLLEWEKWLQGQPQRERIQYAHYNMDEMPAAYHRADIIVVPSLGAEGTSLAVLEGMACGKPVVVTNVGGLANLVLPGFNGKIVHPTPSAIRQALEEYIRSPEERYMHGRDGRSIAEQAFAKKRWEKQWTEVICSIFGLG
jgi:Glycosyltransferase